MVTVWSNNLKSHGKYKLKARVTQPQLELEGKERERNVFFL